jgi:hypothetical protein
VAARFGDRVRFGFDTHRQFDSLSSTAPLRTPVRNPAGQLPLQADLPHRQGSLQCASLFHRGRYGTGKQRYTPFGFQELSTPNTSGPSSMGCARQNMDGN